MLGTILAVAVATKVATKVGKAAVGAAGAAVATGAVVAGAAAVAGVATAAGTAIANKQRSKNLGSADYAVSSENARREAEVMRQRDINNTIKQLYAKFAICYYIALSDGVLAAEEKAELDRLCVEIYNRFPNPGVKSELLKIYNTPNMNFIVLERYIRDVDHTVIASFLTLADETAALDGNTTDAEKQSIYKLRKYLTDKTGYDYLGNYLHLDTDVNMQCQGCGSSMKLIPYDNKAVCPYCGHFIYLKPRDCSRRVR
ncbi:MAG: hypothetical protein IKN80_07825 [Clostridiales bacterium]|nr:hypothetical protein [Clostridiales bacterium]